MGIKNKIPIWTKFKPGGYDPNKQATGYYLDKQRGQEIIDFFSDLLTHVRGPLKGKPFKLELWQAAIIGHLYGWKSKKTGFRRYRELLLLIPRKNGKSLLGAGLALVEMFQGDPNTPEAIIASGDREQARQMFDTVKLMIKSEPEIADRLDVYKNIIKCPQNDGFLRVVSSEAYNLHGANLSLALIDETHIVSRDLVEVLQTSQGSREQPLIVNLSTAGYDRHSILYEKYDYAQKVRNNIVNDPNFFPVIYEAAQTDDWTDKKVWKKSNPNLGKSISMDYFVRECEKAQEVPSYENTFRRLHLDQWTEQETRWLSMTHYDNCVSSLPNLENQRCYGGLDLSTNVDLSAFSLCFPPVIGRDYYAVICFGGVPADNIIIRSKRDGVDYDVWQRQGFIEATPGNVIDYDYILRKIDEIRQLYDLQMVYFDRWGAKLLYTAFEERNLNVVEFGQGYKSMNPPLKELEKLILAGQIKFSDNPVLRWNFSNLVVEQDAAGNLKPSKNRSKEKIDMVVATIMAVAGATAQRARKRSKLSSCAFGTPTDTAVRF